MLSFLCVCTCICMDTIEFNLIMADTENSSSDESLDVTSEKFNPIKALYSSGSIIPVPSAQTYDNITKYEAAIKGVIIKVKYSKSVLFSDYYFFFLFFFFLRLCICYIYSIVCINYCLLFLHSIIINRKMFRIRRKVLNNIFCFIKVSHMKNLLKLNNITLFFHTQLR